MWGEVCVRGGEHMCRGRCVRGGECTCGGRCVFGVSDHEGVGGI